MHPHAHPRNRPSTKGFTLVEIMVVITIVVTLATLAITNVPEFLRRNRVASIVATVSEVRSSLQQYQSSPEFLGMLPSSAPSTEVIIFGTVYMRGAPTPYGASIATTTAGRYTDYGDFLLSEGLIDQPISYRMGLSAPADAVKLIWDSDANQWIDNPDAAAEADYTDMRSYNRLIAATSWTSNTAWALDPNPLSERYYSVNFRHGTGIPVATNQATTVFLSLTGVPVLDAKLLSETIDGNAATPTNNTSSDLLGNVVYSVPTDGLVNVAVYCAHL